MAEKYIHRVQCAAYVHGCTSFLAWEDNVRPEWPDAHLLHLNGWWVDHGRWVCPRHEPPPVNPDYVWRPLCPGSGRPPKGDRCPNCDKWVGIREDVQGHYPEPPPEDG